MGAMISTAELATIKGCTKQYVRRLAQTGKLPFTEKADAANNRKEYLFDIDQMDEKIRERYYNSKRKELGIAPTKTVEKQRSKAVSKPFEEYTENERQQAADWIKILKIWEMYRNKSNRKKADTDLLFVAKMQLEHPEIDISTDILYRKYAAFKNGDIEGLIDKRGGWNKGHTDIPKHILDAFMYFFLDERRLPVSRCYQLMIEWVTEFYPQDLDKIPSERSFRRQAEKLPQAVIALMRYGEKAFTDKYIPYIERLYDDLQANDVWIADNHTFDFITYCENNAQKTHRMYLTAFLDAKSGVLVGWNLTEQPDSHSTLLALRHAIKRFGVPKSVYFDNGSEFLTHDIGGRGHRTRKTWNADDIPPTILQLLDITMHNAIVRNAKAKPIERTFGTLKNHISRVIETFCGGTIIERPESLKYKLKYGIVPEDDQIRAALEVLIDGDFNVSEYGGKERKYKGMSRIDVWNESIKYTTFREAKDEDLSLLLARTTRYQKIKRNGVYIELAGEKLWYSAEDAWKYQGEEVYVRYDPAEYKTVRVYDKATDAYRFTWTLQTDLNVPYITNDPNEIAAGEKTIRAVTHAVHDYSKGLTASITEEQAIDFLTATINRAERGKEKFKIEKPSKFKPVFSDKFKEDNPELADVDEVIIDIDKINTNAIKRKG